MLKAWLPESRCTYQQSKTKIDCISSDIETQLRVVQVIDNVEPCFLIHYANAYEEGDEVVVQAIGWGPEIVRELAALQGSGVFGSFSGGDYNKVPVTSLWSHR